MSDVKSPARAETVAQRLERTAVALCLVSSVTYSNASLDDLRQLLKEAADLLSASPPAEALPSQTSKVEAGGVSIDPRKITPAYVVSWAVDRWNEQVKNRPLVNIHRRSLDDAWRRVMRDFGGDPDGLVGPPHDELLAACVPSPKGDEHLDLAKPASEPAGGRVRRALKIAERRLLDIAQGLALDVKACAEAGAEEVQAALSSPASSSPAKAVEKARSEEREACARMAFAYAAGKTKVWRYAAQDIASAIRSGATEETFRSRKLSSPAEAEALQAGVEAAGRDLLSYLALYDFAERDPGDELPEYMAALTRALSSAPAQEDGSKDLGAHPRGSGQCSQNEGA